MSRALRRATTAGIGGASTLAAALGLFVVHGARTAHPVSVAAATRRYAEDPAYAGRGDFDGRPVGERPAPGVYRYATTGSSRIDRLGVVREYPAITVRVVRHGPGCEWSETVPILREHTETYTACSTGGDQLDTGFGTRLVYFSVPSSSDAACSSYGTRTGGAREPDAVVRFSCTDRDHGMHAEGTTTFIGPDSVVVGGVATSCRRIRIVTVMQGATEGAAVREICADPVTGLVLSETRSVGLSVVSAFVGRVRYAESAEFRLLSTQPVA